MSLMSTPWRAMLSVDGAVRCRSPAPYIPPGGGVVLSGAKPTRLPALYEARPEVGKSQATESGCRITAERAGRHRLMEKA